MIAATVVRAMAGYYLTDLRRYAINTVASFVTTYLLFFVAFSGVRTLSGTAGSEETLSAIVVVFMIWSFAMIAFTDVAMTLLQETMRGTLEQLAMSPIGLVRVMIARAAVVLTFQLILAFAFLFLMMATTGKWLHLDLASLLPLLLLTIVGVQGVGFMMAALAVVLKRVQEVIGIVQFLLLAVLAAPLDQYPFVKLLPLSWGTHLIRRIMIERISVVEIPPGDLLFLMANSATYLVLGLTLFKSAESWARDRGVLGHY